PPGAAGGGGGGFGGGGGGRRPPPPPPTIDSVLGPALASYPEPDSASLAALLAQFHRLPADSVLVGNGSTELIDLVVRVIRPARVAIAEPTFTEYLRASLAAGAAIDHWLAEGDDFCPRPFDPAGADLVWLCHPNNPTGQLWPRAELLAWMAACPATVFVVDEAFMPFVAEESNHSVVEEAARRPNLIVLRSLTKYYALPGLRLGYAVASPTWAVRLRRQQSPWSVNGLAQVVGAAILTDPDHGEYQRRTRTWLDTARPTLTAALRRLEGVEPLPSTANFVLVRLHRGNGPELTQRLRRRNMLIRDASNFVGLDRRYVRIAVRTAEEHEPLLGELRAILEQEVELPCRAH
ncbi:MAG: threonine-phosphate decarboxylase CobD, partial [Gemmataceae bacterium]|nr:threonine-phosphate decarboxylase CobD [Gemmataceae bacterium]MDW8266983.1 threonine-phosphate decarboxylase CobD [Gemmataceae bacterium]